MNTLNCPHNEMKLNSLETILKQFFVSVSFRRNSLDKLRHTRSVAYSVELVLLNKHQISGGGAYLD